MARDRLIAWTGTTLVHITKFRPLRDLLAGKGWLVGVVGALKQRIALQLLLHKGCKVEIGELQQLDRLHQLRRHHQRLGLAEL